MDGFKVYWKLIINSFRKNLSFVLIFICFVGCTTPFFPNGSKDDAKIQQTAVLCINEDKDSVLVQNFLAYLKPYCKFVIVKGNEREMDRALFYRKIDCILVIPEDFTSIILGGNRPLLEEKKLYNDVNTNSMEAAINQYLKVMETESSLCRGDLSQLINAMRRVFEQDTSLNIYVDDISNKEFFIQYLNMLAFLLFCSLLMILGRANIMLLRQNIRNRNRIAPVSIMIIKLKAVVAGFLFSILFTTVFLIGGIFISGLEMLDEAAVLMILNTYIFVLCMASLAYVAGKVFPSVHMLNPAVNVCGVILGFISGVFIKQSELSSVVLRISSMTPVYWFVRNNEELGKKSGITLEDLKCFLVNAGVVVGFFAVYLSIAYIIGRKKRRMES